MYGIELPSIVGETDSCSSTNILKYSDREYTYGEKQYKSVREICIIDNDYLQPLLLCVDANADISVIDSLIIAMGHQTYGLMSSDGKVLLRSFPRSLIVPLLVKINSDCNEKELEIESDDQSVVEAENRMKNIWKLANNAKVTLSCLNETMYLNNKEAKEKQIISALNNACENSSVVVVDIIPHSTYNDYIKCQNLLYTSYSSFSNTSKHYRKVMEIFPIDKEIINKLEN